MQCLCKPNCPLTVEYHFISKFVPKQPTKQQNDNNKKSAN